MSSLQHASKYWSSWIYIFSLFFKLNFKYIGLRDISYSFDTAFTLILYFTLLGSMCFGAVPSTQLYDPSPGHHFNKRCMYHSSSISCAVLGLVELFQAFLPPLWADFIKKDYSELKNYITFLNGPSNGVKCKGRSSWTNNFYGCEWPWQLTGWLTNWTHSNWKKNAILVHYGLVSLCCPALWVWGDNKVHRSCLKLAKIALFLGVLNEDKYTQFMLHVCIFATASSHMLPEQAVAVRARSHNLSPSHSSAYSEMIFLCLFSLRPGVLNCWFVWTVFHILWSMLKVAFLCWVECYFHDMV